MMYSKKYKKSIFYYITIFFLLVIFLGIQANDTNDKVYIIVLVYMLLYFFYAIISPMNVLNQNIIGISLTMVGIWIYGFLIGLLRGNDLYFISRNFAGMLAYLLVFPFCSAELSLKKIKRLLLAISNIAVILPVFTWITGTFFGIEKTIRQIPILNAYTGAVGELRLYYIQYYNRELIYIAFCAALYEILYMIKSLKQIYNLIIIGLTIFYEFFINDSGGDRLAIILLTFIIIMFNTEKTTLRKILLILLIACLYFVYLLTFNMGPIESIFSVKDGGNALRMQELQYFLKNFNLIGYGLGAKLYFSWSTNYVYGTELIYFNIFHKFGIFAILIIFIYIYTVVKSIKFYKESKSLEGIFPIALMGYLVPSLANPILFGVIPVVNHCLTLIFLENNEK